MKVKYFPGKAQVSKAIGNDDPIIMLASLDGKTVLVAGIDDALEHHVLLKKMGHKETEIDSFFRVVVNKNGADWTFVCPAGYKEISDRRKRIESFWVDGHRVISEALRAIGYMVDITIPKRYKRHMEQIGS